jgi:hypothetical protein
MMSEVVAMSAVAALLFHREYGDERRNVADSGYLSTSSKA